MRSRIVACAVVSLAACFATPAPAAQTRAFVLTSDFVSGSLSVVDLQTRAVSQDVASGICADARLRWYDGRLYVIGRFGCDNILVLDPQSFQPLLQFSTGNGSNPSDIVFVTPTKAYLPLYEESSLLVVNPATGAMLDTISLAPLADADGIPEADRAVVFGAHAFVALQRLDRANGFQPTDSSLIAVINTADNTLVDVDPQAPGVQGILLPRTNPVTAFAFDPTSNRLLIGCAGRYTQQDGGICWIDPYDLTADGVAATEAALGGDIGDIAWDRPDHAYALLSDPMFNAALVSWHPGTGAKLATLFSPGGFSLPDIETNDRGELYVCDNKFDAPGVFVLSRSTDVMVAGPLDTGLPPVQVTFDAATDHVAQVREGDASLALSMPRPNPARGEVRFDVVLDHPARVRAEVFDPAGRRVARIVDESRGAGSSALRWNLRDASGRRVGVGLYFVRVSIGEKNWVRRLIVVH